VDLRDSDRSNVISYVHERLNRIFIFGLVRFVSVQLASSHPFSLSGVSSPPDDVVTLPRHVTLPSHEVKMSSLPPLHLPAILHLIVSHLDLKLKH
jgi:hypothetical protein